MLFIDRNYTHLYVASTANRLSISDYFWEFCWFHMKKIDVSLKQNLPKIYPSSLKKGWYFAGLCFFK